MEISTHKNLDLPTFRWVLMRTWKVHSLHQDLSTGWRRISTAKDTLPAEFLKNLSREEQLCLLCALVDVRLRTAALANLQEV